MAFPAKEYERLHTLEQKWGLSHDDMLYAIESGLLRTCIWLPLRFVERLVMKNHKFIHEKLERQEGYVRVRLQDCRRICSNGCARLRIFDSVVKENHVLRLAYEPPQPSISVKLNDLIVLKEDCKKFEEVYGIKPNADKNEKEKFTFSASEDYRYVKIDHREFHLGDMQADIIEQLHNAALSHKPWVHGKTLLSESGSSAVRLRDLFKNKNDWQKLIVSNCRGYYRLNIPIEGLVDDLSNKLKEENKDQYNLAI